MSASAVCLKVSSLARLGDRVLAVALDQPAGVERFLARIGEANLGIGAQPHVTAPSTDLVAEYPGARAVLLRVPGRATA
jgi:hypothetical protein